MRNHFTVRREAEDMKSQAERHRMLIQGYEHGTHACFSQGMNSLADVEGCLRDSRSGIGLA